MNDWSGPTGTIDEPPLVQSKGRIGDDPALSIRSGPFAVRPFIHVIARSEATRQSGVRR